MCDCSVPFSFWAAYMHPIPHSPVTSKYVAQSGNENEWRLKKAQWQVYILNLLLQGWCEESHLHTPAPHSCKTTQPSALLKSPAPSPSPAPRQLVLEPHRGFSSTCSCFLWKDFCYVLLGFPFWTASGPACHTQLFFVCLPAPSTNWSQPWNQAAQSKNCLSGQ